jgi:hypothetical protein
MILPPLVFPGCGFGATTLNITTLSIKGLNVTLSISDTQHNNNTITLSDIMLNVIMLCGITMKAVAPLFELQIGKSFVPRIVHQGMYSQNFLRISYDHFWLRGLYYKTFYGRNLSIFVIS